MTTHLYFVRHGETDLNRDGVMQGRGVDPSINATGRAQADAVANHLADVPVDAVYTSTLRRAQETAAAIAASHGNVSIVVLGELDEMSWGDVEGLPRHSDAVEHAYEVLGRHWKRGDFGKCVDGGESVVDVQTRGLQAVEHIVEQHAGGTVVIVTHGRFLRIVLASLLEEYGLERMNDIPHDNGAINHLVMRDGAFELERLNGTEHLPVFGAVALDSRWNRQSG